MPSQRKLIKLSLIPRSPSSSPLRVLLPSPLRWAWRVLMPGKTTLIPRKPGWDWETQQPSAILHIWDLGFIDGWCHHWPSIRRPLPPPALRAASPTGCADATAPEEPQEGALGPSLTPHQSPGGHLGEKYGQWVAPAVPASLTIVAPFTLRSVWGWTIGEMSALLFLLNEMGTDQVNK